MSKGKTHPHPEALYYHIALDAVNEATLIQPPFDDHKSFRIAECGASALVFSALCLETFINQQWMADKRTAKVLEENDNISIESKWLMLPLLLGAADSFDKGKSPFQTFKELVKLRNHRLVHFKPHDEVHETDKKPKHPVYFGEVVKDLSLARRYIDCIAEMIKELNRLTNGATAIPKFLKGVKYLSDLSVQCTSPVAWLGAVNSDPENPAQN